MIIDGHNDLVLHRWRGEPTEHLDLDEARAADFAGGFFALYVPSPAVPDPTGTPYAVPLPDRIPHAEAARIADELFDELCALPVGRATSVEDFRPGEVTAIVHLEGAEPIAADLSNLDEWYRRGLRSIGLVWSRPNDFAEGVPFRFPSSPDTGGGLTTAGRELVAACNRLGIMVDVSHLNEAGFWDVAQLSKAPLVATHSNAHALSPASRNLLDAQLAAIRDSNGIVGVNFAVTFLREDGALVPDTPITEIVRHIDYLVATMGIDHVAFGSDFDGAVVPTELGGAAGLPKLVAALSGPATTTPRSPRSRTRTGCASWVRRGTDRGCQTPLRAKNPRALRLKTRTPSWLKTSLVVKTVPRPGFFDEGCTSVTVERPDSVSPGRTGAVQRISSTPGEPSDAESRRTARTNMPMKSAVVCQPLAISPPNGDLAAASRSTWNGCGSNRLANSTISCSETVTGPTSTTSPMWKSSQWRMTRDAIDTVVGCAPGNSARCRSPSSASAATTSAAASTRRRRGPSSMPRSAPESRSSTPPTSMATVEGVKSSSAGSCSGRRDQVVLATKFGKEMGDGAERRGSRDYIRAALEASLQRLQTDVIDLYQHHEEDPGTPLEETIGTLDELVDEGTIRAYGTSNYRAETLEQAAGLARTAYVSEQSEYSWLRREAEADAAPGL